MTTKTNDPNRIPVPLVEIDEDGKPVWFPIVRVSRTIPWGYKQDPDDDLVLLPIEEELFLLEVAKEYLKEYSLRTVAEWLSEESGRYISHVGLKRRLEQEVKRNRVAAQAAHFKAKYKAALEREERLAKKRVSGPKTKRVPKNYSFAAEYARRKEASGAEA